MTCFTNILSDTAELSGKADKKYIKISGIIIINSSDIIIRWEPVTIKYNVLVTWNMCRLFYWTRLPGLWSIGQDFCNPLRFVNQQLYKWCDFSG